MNTRACAALCLASSCSCALGIICIPHISYAYTERMSYEQSSAIASWLRASSNNVRVYEAPPGLTRGSSQARLRYVAATAEYQMAYDAYWIGA